MSHHASSDSEFPNISGADEARRKLDERFKKLTRELGVGATGDFPRGQIHRTDEGGLSLAVTVEKNTVIIAFGKPVAWFGMSRVEACELADLLKKRASEL